jgi:hypothetical protein
MSHRFPTTAEQGLATPEHADWTPVVLTLIALALLGLSIML